MKSLKQKFLDDMGYTEKGWSLDWAGTLICPCGHRVEDDGECPNGHKSPIPV